LTARGFEERWQLAAWVERLDDKELIYFSCHNLFLHFDPMCVKDGCLPGRSGLVALGSEALINQSTGLAWTDRRWLIDSDALNSKALGWDRRRWAQRCWPRRRWPEDRWLERCWPERRLPQRHRHLSMSKSRSTAGGRKTLLGRRRGVEIVQQRD